MTPQEMEDAALLDRALRFRSATMRDLFVLAMNGAQLAHPGRRKGAMTACINAARRLEATILEYADGRAR